METLSYAELFDWKVERMQSDEIVYYSVETGGTRRIPGGIGSEPDGEGHVTVYVAVDNIKKYLEKGEKMGVKTVMEPSQVSPTTEIGLFLDPKGRLLGLMRPTGSS